MQPNLAQAARGFAALGEPTRLAILSSLVTGQARSITDLARILPISRQAVTKHLVQLHDAGLLDWDRQGRAASLQARPEGLQDMQDYLTQIGKNWERALLNLKVLVEAKVAEGPKDKPE